MITVLITGCGGAIGLSTVKALRTTSLPLRLIGVDADPYAACFYIQKTYGLDKTYLIPPVEDPEYLPTLINICRTEETDVIFPCTDVELEPLAAAKTKMTQYGTNLIISPLETIRVCRDKWLTYQHLRKTLPIVQSALPDAGLKDAIIQTGLPAMIKPRHGWGSRETYRVDNIAEARTIVERVPTPIIQTWLEGDEYTVDGLTDTQGRILCVVPRRRVRVLGGLSFQGITVRDQNLITLGNDLAHQLKLVGPFNFQVRKVNGTPHIFEINPRFAGTGILSVRAGVNIPLLAVKAICNMHLPDHVEFEEGTIVSRYFEEVFFKTKDVKRHAN